MATPRKKIGVVLSAGGGAFGSAAKITEGFPLDFFVVTDRECDAEKKCSELGIEFKRIEQRSNRDFSVAAAETLKHAGVHVALLHFSRLVTSDLFSVLPTCNVHPSLLPAFAGMSAVARAFSSGARFLGATLHWVDEGVDTGKIIAQTVAPILPGADLEWCNRVSYIQKVYLTLLLFDLVLHGRLVAAKDGPVFDLSGFVPGNKTNPSLNNSNLSRRFDEFQSALKDDVVS